MIYKKENKAATNYLLVFSYLYYGLLNLTMDTEEMTLEEQCEHLMNVVVESRKRFGKMCIDYEQKTSLMENKILNLQIETISNYRFKPKNPPPNIDIENMTNDIDTFNDEVLEMNQRINNLQNNVKNSQMIVFQLKADKVGNKLRNPLTAEAMLASAKNKIDI